MLYQFAKSIVAPIAKAVYRPAIEGAEHIPATGGAVLASNHLSFSDPVFLPIQIRRPVFFLAKSDYFTGRGLKGRVVRFFMKGIGTVPVDRSGGRNSDAAIRAGLTILERGDLLGIYPEGTRSPDGVLYKGKVGVARLALEARVPVVPVAMIGTLEAHPVGTLLPRRRPIGVRVGAPLDFSAHYGRASDRAVLREVTERIMLEIQRLSGQRYDPQTYAATVKRRLTAAGKQPDQHTGEQSDKRTGEQSEPRIEGPAA